MAALVAHSKATGGIAGFVGADAIADENFWDVPSDILVPAALAAVINLSNAARIRAPLIIVAANGPITASADEVLRKKGCVVDPM